mgnify:CR=1 FL=1
MEEIIDESKPPDKNEPTSTSDIKDSSTESIKILSSLSIKVFSFWLSCKLYTGLYQLNFYSTVGTCSADEQTWSNSRSD